MRLGIGQVEEEDAHLTHLAAKKTLDRPLVDEWEAINTWK